MAISAALLSPLRIFRMFSSSADAPRQRRPTDVLTLMAALLLGTGSAIGAPGPTPLDTAVGALLDEFAGTLGWIWQIGYALLLAWALVLLLAPVVRRRQGRLRLLVDYAAAMALAFGLTVLLTEAGGGELSEALDGLITTDPPPVFPAVRLAVCGALIVVASPHVTRPFRLVGRVVLTVGAIATIALQIGYASAVLAALAVAFAAASLVHLALGSPGGQLTAGQVTAALTDLGVDTDEVTFAPTQVPGEQLLVGHRAGGDDVLVKVFGRDAWDAQLIGSTWTALRRRGEAGTRRWWRCSPSGQACRCCLSSPQARTAAVMPCWSCRRPRAPSPTSLLQQ